MSRSLKDLKEVAQLVVLTSPAKEQGIKQGESEFCEGQRVGVCGVASRAMPGSQGSGAGRSGGPHAAEERRAQA